MYNEWEIPHFVHDARPNPYRFPTIVSATLYRVRYIVSKVVTGIVVEARIDHSHSTHLYSFAFVVCCIRLLLDGFNQTENLKSIFVYKTKRTNELCLCLLAVLIKLKQNGCPKLL